MTFIRTKKIKGHTYYYRVQSYMENGKIKQKALEYLGKEIPEKYFSEYKKRGSRVTSLKTGSPDRLALGNRWKAKGGRHGRKKTRKVLSD